MALHIRAKKFRALSVTFWRLTLALDVTYAKFHYGPMTDEKPATEPATEPEITAGDWTGVAQNIKKMTEVSGAIPLSSIKISDQGDPAPLDHPLVGEKIKLVTFGDPDGAFATYIPRTTNVYSVARIYGETKLLVDKVSGSKHDPLEWIALGSIYSIHLNK